MRKERFHGCEELEWAATLIIVSGRDLHKVHVCVRSDATFHAHNFHLTKYS